MRFSVLMFLAVLATAVPAAAQDACSWSRDLRLINGKIHTVGSAGSRRQRSDQFRRDASRISVRWEIAT